MIFPSLADPKSPAQPKLAYPNPSTSLSNFTFHDFLSIVNPLQHLPIVSTIYRAVTGDTIKPLERVAGDTLYGGLWGLVSSVANVAFEEITGKDFGATAVALVEDQFSSSRLADNTPSNTAPASVANAAAAPASTKVAALAPTWSATGAPAVLPSPSVAVASTTPSIVARPANDQNDASLALLNAMNTKGVDSALSRRAAAAYQKSIAASSAETDPIF